MGGWRQWQEAAELLAMRDLYIDTAFSIGKMVQDTHYYSDEELMLLSHDGAKKIISAFGADHVLFGTDSPWSDQKTAIDDILKLSIADDVKEKILHKNAEVLLGI